jgi:hypothetical protein
MAEIKFPSEIVDLPSRGILYPKDSPLSKGTVELKYMTARSEDILTNTNYLDKGVVVDKLLQDLIVDKTIPYAQLLNCDKNALLIAARIMGYGKDYKFEYRGKTETVDLAQLPTKELTEVFKNATENKFDYELPASKIKVTFKLLTHADEQAIEQELKGLKKISPEASPELSTRMKYIITSVDGNADNRAIRSFVDNGLLAMDSRALRRYITKIQPDIDLRFYPEDGPEGGVAIPIGISFLWPDTEL